MALAKVLVINDVHEINDKVLEGQWEHPVDGLIVFGAWTARSVRLCRMLVYGVYRDFVWAIDLHDLSLLLVLCIICWTLLLLDIRWVYLMEQEGKAKSQHICKLLLNLFVNLIGVIAWFLSIKGLTEEHQVSYEILKLDQPLLNYLFGASLD